VNAINALTTSLTSVSTAPHPVIHKLSPYAIPFSSNRPWPIKHAVLQPAHYDPLSGCASSDVNSTGSLTQGRLVIAVINCRSLLPKIAILNLFTDFNNCDILFLCETWLCDKTCSSSLNIPGFVIYRKDRRNRGGGVIILVKKYLASCQVELSYPANIISDVCCVDVQFVNKTYRLICIYRPQRKIEMLNVSMLICYVQWFLNYSQTLLISLWQVTLTCRILTGTDALRQLMACRMLF